MPPPVTLKLERKSSPAAMMDVKFATMINVLLVKMTIIKTRNLVANPVTPNASPVLDPKPVTVPAAQKDKN
jgi:hypothetical protein